MVFNIGLSKTNKSLVNAKLKAEMLATITVMSCKIQNPPLNVGWIEITL